MIILKEKSLRNVDAHTKRVVDRVASMAASGRLDGLSLTDFRVLQSVLQRWLNNENPEFIQGSVADWLARNDIMVKSKGSGFVIVEQYLPVKAIYREGLLNFREANNLPVIAKMGGVSTNPKITSVVRQDTIFSTLQAMGLNPYINKMKNVVVETADSPTATAVASTIYQQFGTKCSFVLTWEGQMKLYWSPDAHIDWTPALAYAKTAGLPPPNPHKYLA